MAEQNTNTNSIDSNTTQGQQGNEPSTPTVEELMTQLASARAESLKFKNSLDKASAEASDYKKQLRARQTAEEQAAEAKKEAEEQQKAYIADLEKFKRTAEAKARYAMQGMSSELAEKAAQAEIDGDMDALSSIQKQYTDQLVKAKEAEWLRNRPQPQAGTGYASMTAEEIMKISDREERLKAIAMNQSAFSR